MAKVIEAFSKKRFKYDWATWMNGSVYRATQGEDFDCSPEGFKNTLYSKAWQNDRKVIVSLGDDFVEFQFSKPAKSAGKR